MHSACLFRLLMMLSALLALIAAAPMSVCGTYPVFDQANFVGDPGEVELIDLLSGSDGRVVLADRTSHLLSGLPNQLIKINVDGAVIWTNRSLPRVEQLAADTQGNLYAIGSEMILSRGEFTATDWFAANNIPTEGSGTAYMAKLSPAGELLWVRLFGESLWIEGLALTFEKDGSYYVGGQYREGGAQIGNVVLPVASPDQSGIYIAKFRPDGSLVWARAGISPQETYQAIKKLALDTHGNLYAAVAASAGMSLGSTQIDRNPLLKFDTSGNLVWARTPDAADQVGLPTVAVDAQGNAFVAYSTWSSSPFLAKYSAAGDLLWQSRYEALSGSQLFETKVLVDADGNCLVAATFYRGQIALGELLLDTESNWEGMVAKYSSAGELKWAVQTYGLDPMGNGGGSRISWVNGVSLALDPAQRIIMGGQLRGTVVFGSLALEGPPNSSGETRLFLARLTDPETVRPSVRIARVPDGVELRWPAVIEGFSLESSASLTQPGWMAVPADPELDAEDHVVKIPHSSAAQYFRLRRP